MPAPTGLSKYDRAYYNLTDPNSDLNMKKKKFEDLFDQFLTRYRPYSSVGKSLSEPVFNKRPITV
jgi:hypothetical protein